MTDILDDLKWAVDNETTPNTQDELLNRAIAEIERLRGFADKAADTGWHTFAEIKKALHGSGNNLRDPLVDG